MAMTMHPVAHGGPGVVLLCVALAGFAGCASTPPAPATVAAPPSATKSAGGAAPATAKRSMAKQQTKAKPRAVAASSSVLSEEQTYKVLVAEFAVRRGAPAIAVTNYLEVARETKHPELARRAVTLAVFARDNEAALEAAEIWAKAKPDDMDARQIIVAMQVRAGHADRALASLEDLLARDPDHAELHLRALTNLFSREQDPEVALAVLRRLADRRPEYTPAQLAFALLAVRANQLPEARAVMERLLASGQMDAAVAQSYLLVLQQQGDTAGALAWLKEVLDRRPDDFELRLMYARLLADVRRFDDAFGQFELLLQAQPEQSDVIFALGLLSLQAERVEAAAGYFDRLLALNRGYTDQAHFYLGQIAESRQASAAAMQHYRRVQDTFATADSYLDAQIRIAVLLAHGGQIDEARARLHGMRPHNEGQRVQLALAEGELLADHQRPEDAMAVYDAALDERYDKNLLYARAMLAEKIDRLDILEADLRAIIAREPDDVEALNALGYTLADRTNRFQEAYQLITRALQLDDSKFHILDSMGWVLFRMGRLDEAANYLKKAQELRNDPEVAVHLGEVLRAMGDKDGARAVLDQALRATPDDRKLLDAIERLR